MLVALAITPGVSGDECEVFLRAFAALDGVELVRVGATRGEVSGLGPVQHVDRSWDEVAEPDIVVVPGGLGCDRTARDGPLGDWLRGVAGTARWVVGSSTGSVVLAAAGLLDGHDAATHWLAGSRLEAFGSPVASQRVVEHGRVITCQGRVTAADVALLLVARLRGPEAARRVRDELARPLAPPPRRRRGVPDWRLRRRARPVRRPRNAELEVSEWVHAELVEMQVDDQG